MNTITVHFGALFSSAVDTLELLDTGALLSGAMVFPPGPASSELRQYGFDGRLTD
jgi:hypothetical protein